TDTACAVSELIAGYGSTVTAG
ncbi:hypothetical protein, partial [Pseudomonas syringae group genomosp. 7]